MLATIALLAMSLSRLHAQSNSEYTFRQQSVVDGDSYGPGDPVPILTMDCLAANGDGQWSMTSASNGTAYPAGWYLLGNGLYKPSQSFVSGDPNHPECVAPGTVANGTFSAPPTQPKVATNLEGSVRYVWPSSDRNSFIINGFDAPDINISLTGIPNPSNTRQIIDNTAHPIHFWVAVTNDGSTNRTVTNLPIDYRDWFDVAMDANFIYIVWRSDISSGTGPGIYSTVLALDGTIAQPPAFVGPGIYPTVSCDGRNAPVVPTFDVAYLTGIGPGASVQYLQYSSAPPISWTLNEYFPVGSTTATIYIPLHARVVVSSILGGAATHAVYVIIPGNDAHHNSLILHNPAMGSVANYGDGPQLSSYADPDLTGLPAQAVSVVDEPICAFANPYDNQTGIYDQFHCLYRLEQLEISSGPPAVYKTAPLLIMQGVDNGQHGTSDTRLAVSYVGVPGNPNNLVEADKFVGAINQMGIHVHWRNSTMPLHYYSRDTSRTFDESIDENTLVTDICRVTNGTIHGGTAGATIVKNTQMTVWTDPNYGQTSSLDNYGLYQPRSGVATTVDNAQIVGRLEFVGDNVQLNVGDNSYTTSEAGTHYNSATLAVVPYILFDFLGMGQGVTVNGNSYFQYYGLNETHGSTAILATPFTDGTSSGYGGGTITLTGLYPSALGSIEVPAFLEVHGGADFYTGKFGALVSNYGQIDILYEHSIYPINSGGVTALVNSLTTGHMTLLGQTTLTNSAVNGNIPSGALAVILTVDAGYQGFIPPTYTPTSTYQYQETNCAFRNSDITGTSELLFGHANRAAGTASFWNSTFNGGTSTDVRIHCIDPLYDILIESMNFDDMMTVASPSFGFATLIENDQDPVLTSYGTITITGNTFKTILSPKSGIICPIYLKGFDGQANGPSTEDHSHQTSTISANTFTYTNSHANSDGANAAITLENSTANVLGNTITDPGFETGIRILASPFHLSSPPTTLSLICSNTIGQSTDADINIQSDHLSGYVKLNILGPSSEGYSSSGTDRPHLIFNKISGYLFNAISVLDQAVVDMSGVHGPSDDYAAYNTITGNVDTNPVIELSGTSPSVLLGKLSGSTWANYGENNFVLTPIGATNLYIIGSTTGFIYPMGNLDNNVLGSNIDPATGTGYSSPNGTDPCNWSSVSTSEVDALGITYTATIHSALLSQSSVPTVSCEAGTGYGPKRKSAVKITSHEDGDTCQVLYAIADNYISGFEWQKAYDTAKIYIEHCPNYLQSWRAFLLMNQAAQGLNGNGDTSLYSRYRQWLESVLYLNNTDPEYFCVCLEAIGGTFNYPSDTTSALLNARTNRGLAILQWMLIHTNCDTAMLRRYYQAGRDAQYQSWQNDTTVKLDTTLPSMHDLGLDSLLQIHLRMSVSQPTLFTSILQAFSLSENPFQSNTMLRFNLNSMAYVRTEVYDELGRMVLGDASGKVYESGPHQLPIDLSKFASGAYYLRISLADGEARTLKMVKQE